MNTWLLPMTLVVLFALTAPAAPADLDRARELMLLTRSHEFAAGAFKLSIKRKQAAAGFTAAQLACIDAIPSTSFAEPVAAAFAEGLSDAELATAFEFFRSAAGKKLLAVMKANIEGKPQPVEITPADNASIRKFEATSAGNKFMVKPIAVSSDVVANAARELSIDAVQNCPKPAL